MGRRPLRVLVGESGSISAITTIHIEIRSRSDRRHAASRIIYATASKRENEASFCFSLCLPPSFSVFLTLRFLNASLSSVLLLFRRSHGRAKAKRLALTPSPSLSLFLFCDLISARIKHQRTDVHLAVAEKAVCESWAWGRSWRKGTTC